MSFLFLQQPRGITQKISQLRDQHFGNENQSYNFWAFHEIFAWLIGKLSNDVHLVSQVDHKNDSPLTLLMINP